MIRIVLVDDQQLIRQGMHTLLELEPDLTVVGMAGNGREAITVVGQYQPDVVLMDVRMPEMDGVVATGVLTAQFPHIGVIILTTFDDNEYIFEGLRAGARGYLLKDVSSDELALAVRSVAAGHALLQPSITRKVVAEFARLRSDAPPPTPITLPQDPLPLPLTAREVEVLHALAAGYSNREIAEQFVITEGTVKNHVSNLLAKLEVRDRVQAIVKARALKLIK